MAHNSRNSERTGQLICGATSFVLFIAAVITVLILPPSNIFQVIYVAVMLGIFASVACYNLWPALNGKG